MLPVKPTDVASIQRGQVIFSNECTACHGRGGAGVSPATLGLGLAPPNLTGLTARNDGAFPRAFVQRFVRGTLEKEDPDAAMPEYRKAVVQHTATNGGAAGQISDDDMIALLDYLETIQK